MSEPAKPRRDPLLNFKNMLAVIWRHLNLPPPTKRQYEMADFLQQKGIRRKMIQAWRGASKSWITCAYVVWRLYCDNQLNLLIISASKPKADEFTSFTKRLITEVPCLQHLGKVRGDDQRWSTVSFDVAPAEADPNPSVKSAGITGQITGSRADEIIADDIETLDNSLTQTMREKLMMKLTEFDAILKPGDHTRITFLGTPQSINSIYKTLPEKQFTVRIWPARYPDEQLRARYGGKLAPGISDELDANPRLVGKSVEPTRFDDMDLAGREASMGRAMFTLQFMLDTELSDEGRYPLKVRDCLVSWLDNETAPERFIWAATPEWYVNDLPMVGLEGDRWIRPVPMPNLNYLPYTGSVMVIDPAGTGKDETGYAVVKTLHGYLFLLDAGGFPPGQGSSELTMDALAKTAAKWKVNKVLIESNFGDGMFTKLLTPHLMRHHPVSTEDVKHHTQKERRICDTLEPLMQSHRLIISQALVTKDFESTSKYTSERAAEYQLFWQLTHLSRDRGSLAHDDRVDALAMACAYFASAMAADSEKKVAQSRDLLMKDELARYMKHAIGFKGSAGPVFAVPRTL